MSGSNGTILAAGTRVVALLAVTGAYALSLTACAAKVSVDFGVSPGVIKPLHGVNNAPVRLNGKQDEFRKAGIPFVRTHDTAYAFGGTHYVDIPNVFPNFDAKSSASLSAPVRLG